MSDDFPVIELLFQECETQKDNAHMNALKNVLSSCLPSSFFSQAPLSPDKIDEKKQEFEYSLPIVASKQLPDSRGFSFFMLCRSRENVFKFFFDVISLWLIPGKRMNVPLIYAADFRIKEFGAEVYSACEILVNIHHQSELEELLHNFPILEQEARLGLQSRYHAERIASVRGISNDEKKQLVQTRLSRMINRLPNAFDKDLITEMQHFLILCPQNFESKRDPQTLAKAIYSQYFFRKDIRQHQQESPKKRFVRIKLFKSLLYSKENSRPVLSCVIGINFLQQAHETINEQLILSAMHNYLPSIQIVPGSLVVNRRAQGFIGTIYLEVEKSTEALFSLLEIKHLKQKLLVDLGDRVGHLMHPVFMPRNEEEIMRNVLILSQQVRFIRDLPQVIITFDHQVPGKLLFTVTLVRICQPGDTSIEESFSKSNTSLQYIHDRIKMLSMLRKKYSKEAAIFQVTLQSHKFLREDQTIDLSKARQEVVDELTKIVGEFRDYNGGMISKQNEALAQLTAYFTAKKKKFNQLLLENLFYSLTPVVMRTVLATTVLAEFFLLLNEATHQNVLQSKDSKKIFSKGKEDYYYIWVCSDSLEAKERIGRAVRDFPRTTTSFAQSFMHIYEIHYCGFLLHSRDDEERALLYQILQNSLEEERAATS